MFIGVHQRQLWFNLSVHGPSVNYIYSNDKSFNSEVINCSNCIYISGRLFNVIYIITDQIHAAHTPKSNTFVTVLSCINSGIGCHTLLIISVPNPNLSMLKTLPARTKGLSPAVKRIREAVEAHLGRLLAVLGQGRSHRRRTRPRQPMHVRTT